MRYRAKSILILIAIVLTTLLSPMTLLAEEGEGTATAETETETPKGSISLDNFPFSEQDVKTIIRETLTGEPLSPSNWYKEKNDIYLMPLYVASSKSEDIKRKDMLNIKKFTLPDFQMGKETVYWYKMDDEHTLFKNMTLGNINRYYERGTNKIKQAVLNWWKTSEREYDNFFYLYMHSTLELFGRNLTMATDKRLNDVLLGIDQYGNIVSSHKEIVVPFYQNPFIWRNGKTISSNQFPYKGMKEHPYVLTYSTFYNNYFGDIVQDGDIRDIGTINVFGSSNTTLDLSSINSLTANSYIKNIYGNVSIDALVEQIYNTYAGELKEFHAQFFTDIINAESDPYFLDDNIKFIIYNSPSSFGDSSAGVSQEELTAEYLQKNLLQRVLFVFEHGVGFLIDMTLTNILEKFYSFVFLGFAGSGLFYTNLLSDTWFWDIIISYYLLFVVIVSVGFISLMLYNIVSGKLKFKTMVIRISILLAALVGPVVAYSFVVDITFNKPIEFLAQNEIKRMMALERWTTLALREKDNASDVDSTIGLALNNIRSKVDNYLIEFPSYSNANALQGSIMPDKEVNTTYVEMDDLFDFARSGTNKTLYQFLADMGGIDETKVNYELYGLYYEPIVGEANKKYKVEVGYRMSEIFRNIYGKVVNEERMFNDFKLQTDILLGTENTEMYQEVYQSIINKDYFGIYDILRDYYGLTADKFSGFEFTKLLREINEAIVDDYITSFSNLNTSYYTSDIYNLASREITALSVFVNINGKLGIDYSPTGVSLDNIKADSYLKVLFIPLSKFTPYGYNQETVASYIGLETDIVTIIVFVIYVMYLLFYLTIKTVVISIVLLPIIVVLMVYNYFVIRDKHSKAWFGALFIIGAFALVHLGFVLIWKIGVFLPYFSFYNNNKVGDFLGMPVALIVPIITIAYISFAYKNIFKPIFNTVKADFRNLGGGAFASMSLNMTNKLRSGANKLASAAREDDYTDAISPAEKDDFDAELKADTESKKKVDNSGITPEPKFEAPATTDKSGNVQEQEVVKQIISEQEIKDRQDANKVKSEEVSSKPPVLPTQPLKVTDGQLRSTTDGIVGSAIDLNSEESAKAVSRLLAEKGISTNVKGKTVEAYATSAVVNEALRSSKEQLKGQAKSIKIDMKANKGKSLTGLRFVDDTNGLMDNNEATRKVAESFKKSGIIDEYTVEKDPNTGEERISFKYSGNKNILSKRIREAVGNENSKLSKPISGKDVLTVKSNQMLNDRVKSMLESGELSNGDIGMLDGNVTAYSKKAMEALTTHINEVNIINKNKQKELLKASEMLSDKIIAKKANITSTYENDYVKEFKVENLGLDVKTLKYMLNAAKSGNVMAINKHASLDNIKTIKHQLEAFKINIERDIMASNDGNIYIRSEALKDVDELGIATMLKNLDTARKAQPPKEDSKK